MDTKLIKEYIQECKSDGVKKEQIALYLPSFLNSLANQSGDPEIKGLVGNRRAIAQLLDELY
jgi:hypothetical protein